MPHRARAFVMSVLVTVSLVASGCAGSSAGTGSGGGSPNHTPATLPVVALKVRETPFRVTLKWAIPKASAVDGIEITRDGAVRARLPATATRFVDRDVTPRASYIYTVVTSHDGQRSAPTSASARLPKPPLATARLSGYFDIRLKVVSQSGYGNDIGTSAGWHFKPVCLRGACDSIWADKAAAAHARAARHGANYHLSYHGFYFITCSGAHATTNLDLTLRVTKARVTGGQWMASRVQGTLSQSELEQLGCAASQAIEHVLGRAILM